MIAIVKYNAGNVKSVYNAVTRLGYEAVVTDDFETLQNADKVIFLMDRIELGTQSLEQYNNFADTDDFVQSTENTHALISKLKSTNPNEVLIVSSIQKMSNIKQEEGGLKAHDIEQMQKKRIGIDNMKIYDKPPF